MKTSVSKKKFELYSKNIIFCSKCQKVPLITIFTKNPIKVKVYCLCGAKITDISTYLTEIRRNNFPFQKNTCEADNHQKEKSSSYCQTCHKNLCYECLINHNEDHIIPPIDIQCDIYKDKNKRNHDSFLAFCFNCYKHICSKCDNGHSSHYLFYLSQVMNTNHYSRTKEFNTVVRKYKAILRQIKDNAIKELGINVDRKKN